MLNFYLELSHMASHRFHWITYQMVYYYNRQLTIRANNHNEDDDDNHDARNQNKDTNCNQRNVPSQQTL